jgi:twinkle protein
MQQTMYDVLRDENITLPNDGEGNQKVKCPSCQPPHKASDRPLSVTIENGAAVWNCHHCGFKGTTMIKRSNFTTAPKKEYVRPTPPTEINTPATLFSYFAKRGISKETVNKKGIYVADKYWMAFPYLDGNSEVINIKYRTKDKKFKQSPNAQRSLYNYERAKDAESVIFVEGEMDVLTLIECGFDNVVTLPDGAPQEAKFNEKDARFTALETCPLKAKKIILFTDNDGAGKSLHSELLHRFGKDQCWYVDYPSDCKDANEILLKHGAERVRECVNSAVAYPVDGLYKANEYYGAVLDLYNGNYVKPIEVGYANLDKIYKVMKGTLHVVTGIPNHGKSSLLDQLAIKISEEHGWRYAVYSPEHSTQMHLRRLVQLKMQKAFDEGFANRMTKEELQEGLSWINERFYFMESKEAVPDIDQILATAKGSVLKYGCDGIIIDPYNEVSAVRKGNAREDEHIRDFISKCKRFAQIHNVVVWIVAHPTKLPKNQNDGSYAPPTAYDISGASHWYNQSDAILTVHRDFDENTIRVITRKIREQGLYGQIGEAKFSYNNTKRVFEEFVNDSGWDDAPPPTPHWADND